MFVITVCDTSNWWNQACGKTDSAWEYWVAGEDPICQGWYEVFLFWLCFLLFDAGFAGDGWDFWLVHHAAVACVFSRCATNRVDGHQVVQIAACSQNTCPCILERMIALFTMPCFPCDFLALVLNLCSLGTSSHLGGSLHEQRRLYRVGKTVLASQIKDGLWGGHNAWQEDLFTTDCPCWSLSWWNDNSQEKWSIRICRKGTEGK